MTAQKAAPRKIALIGAGKIGRLAALLLRKKYNVTVYDIDEGRAKESTGGRCGYGKLDVSHAEDLRRALDGKEFVISCCPYFCNEKIAVAARELGLSYCDLSEDIASGMAIERVASGAPTRFIPHCGLAPGLTQIIANHMVQRYEPVTSVSIRVGALPENPTNALKYNLTWSTDGLINEYGNPCEVLIDGQLRQVQPLEGYERLIIGDVEYEAFNTSGGLGTLARSLAGKVKELNYKTLRYLGHRDLMKFLMVDLQLNEYRGILKQILESAVPTTQQDRVVILISVVGRVDGSLRENTYTKVIPHGEIEGIHWTAIQIATASSLASVVDLCLRGRISKTGLVRQEEIDYEAFIESEYGSVFR
ncbi:MAG: saccharopine dehydrogenase C-terminal domain-containing protein [Nitrospiraceae bacterium]